MAIGTGWQAVDSNWQKFTQGVPWEFVADARFDGSKVYARAAIHNNGTIAYTGTNKYYTLRILNSSGTQLYSTGRVKDTSTYSAGQWKHWPSDNGVSVAATKGTTYKFELKWEVADAKSGTYLASGVCVWKPTGLGISVTGRTYNTITANTTVSGWNGGSDCYRVFKVLQQKYDAGVSALGKKSTSTSTGAVSLSVSRSTADDIVGTAFNIAGAKGYYVGLYASNSAGDERYAPTTVYYTPPAPLPSNPTATVTSYAGSTETRKITWKGAAADGTNNATDSRVQNQYRYSTNNGSSWTGWMKAQDNVSPASEASFSYAFPENCTCIIEVRQATYGDTSQVTASKSVTFNTSATPSGLAVSVNSVGKNSAVLSGSISSYGRPIADNAYIELAVCNSSAYGNPYRFQASSAKATSMSNVTIDNNDSTGSTALNLRPNSKYYAGIYATNRTKSTGKTGASFITLPGGFSAISITTDNTKATVSFTRESEGTAATVKTYYSHNNSTWTECTSPFSFEKDDSGTYTVYLKATNSTGSTTSSKTYTIEASNVSIGDKDGKARKLYKMYVGDNNHIARQIYKLYIGDADGKARKVIG